MQAGHAMKVLRERTLLITPGDREDMILASIAAHEQLVMGLILTGGFHPSGAVLRRLRDASLFTYLVETDTYTTAQAVDAILVKTHPTDTEKIATIIDIVDSAIDTNALLERL